MGKTCVFREMVGREMPTALAAGLRPGVALRAKERPAVEELFPTRQISFINRGEVDGYWFDNRALRTLLFAMPGQDRQVM